MKALAIFFLLVSSWGLFAQSAGPNNSTNIYDGGGGSIPESWTNPNLARTQNDLYATVVTTTKNKRTSYLMAQNFGFAIPAGANINGIVVQIDRYATATMSGSVSDNSVELIDATGSINGTSKPAAGAWATTDTDTYILYGGTTDVWGITDWTPAKINNTNFGVAITAQTSNTNSATFNLFVDEIRVTVYYTLGGAQRYAVATGNWSSTGSWSSSPGGAPGASVPNSTNDVFIGGGFTITQDITSGGGASCNSLTIGTSQATPTGNLSFNNNNGDITIGAGGLVITSNGNVLGGTFAPTLTVAGDLTLNAVLTNRSFTIKIDGAGTETIDGTGTLGILNIQNYTTNTGNITVSNKLIGPALRLINGASGYLKYTGTTANADTDVLNSTTVGNTVEYGQTTTDAPSFNLQKPSNTYYNLIISGNAPKLYAGDVTINGNLTITSTGILDNQNSRALTLYGNWTNNNGAAGFIPNTCANCVVIFAGGNAQTITNAAGQTFNRIEVTKTSGTTLTAVNNITVNSRLLMTSGNFTVGSNSLNGAGALTFNDGELLIGTTGVTVPELAGAYTLSGGTITFNGAGAQTIRSSASSPAVSSYINVQFLGSGTKSLSGAITVSTSLVIGGTATLDVTASNYAITLTGNWTNTSTFLARSGTVTLNGAASQTITNAAGETFNNLTVNNSTASSAIVFGGPVTVNGVMTFTDGHVITTASNLLTLGSGASATGAADGSHVDGPVAKITASTSKFDFPIGNGSNYMPASVTPTSASATTFVAEYFSVEQTLGTSLGAGVDHISSQDYWFINRNSGSANASVTLVWEYVSSIDAEITNMSQLLVAQWNNSLWASQGNTATTGTNTAGSITSNVISSFTAPYFTIGSSTTANPLSINRYFVTGTGTWDATTVWAYRAGGTPNASVPTSTKNVIIVAGNICTISDASAALATVDGLSLTILGTLTMANAQPRDITVNVGAGGLTLGAAADITGADTDVITVGGNIVLNNTATPAHPALEVNFSSQGNTISGTGKLRFLHVNQNNQINAGTVTFVDLDVDNTLTNNATITVTGALTGGSTLTNGASAIFNWQSLTSPTGHVINATTVGNTINLTNNSIALLDIDLFVTGSTYYNLTLNGTNTFRETSNMDINGNLTINGIYNNSSANHKLNIGGNWINNNGTGGFINGSNDITFDGSSAQTIETWTTSGHTTAADEVFANLVISNTSSTGVTISSGNVSLSSSLTLIDGILFTGTNHLLIIQDNAASSSGSANSFIDGPMIKIGNDQFVFPMGDGSTWARIEMLTLANYGVDTQITCQYFHNAYSNTTTFGPLVNNVSTVEYWQLDRTFDVGNNGQCLVRLYWENQAASGIQDLADLRVGHYYNGASGVKWYNFGGSTTDNGDGTGNIVSTTTFTTFSPITYASENGFNPLPVELLSFTAEPAENLVELKWSTASELNNDHFTLERSYNGIDFIAFADEPGSGTTKQRKDYSKIDNKPYGGLSYYRLSQTDFDGTRTYLDVIAVKRASSAWSVFPNPFNGSQLNFQLPENRGTRPFLVTIINTQGMVVYSKEITPTIDSQMDVILDHSLASGVYYLTITDGLNREVRKMVVTK